MNVTIDCSRIRNREMLHQAFAEALDFPDWYGCNLDALYDCLGMLHGTLRLENWEEAQNALGKYGQAARRAIVSAAMKNTGLEVIL